MLTNAFSFNMLPAGFTGAVHIRPATAEEARDALLRGGSAVGHADTAAIFSIALGRTVPAIRRTVLFRKGDSFIVGQYRGERLPPGVTSLPDGAAIEWMAITVG